jgi:peptide/nickel transport system permease protein
VTTTEDHNTQSSSQWKDELDRVGVVRQLLRARRWYGIDWWLIAISLIILLIFIFMALFPSLVAPYDPLEEAGPTLLAPGESTRTQVLVVRTDSGARSLRDLGQPQDRIGILRGGDSYLAIQYATDLITEADQAEGLDVSYTPRRVRFDTLEDALTALDNGEIQAVVEEDEALQAKLGDYPSLIIVETLPGQEKVSFLLGTNQLGHDVLSRLIWGTRIALFVGLVSAIVSVVLGVPLGLISGFIGGPLDRLLTLVMDSIYSFPGLILAIAISAMLGPGMINIIVSIAVLYIPTYFRIVRGQTLTVKEQLYVEAAYSLGANRWSVLRYYVYPNVIPSIVVIFSVNVADSILTEAGLSFLGLGLPPDTVDWGIDLARGQDRLLTSWWLITMPGLMVATLVLSFSMLGESLSEILNPRLNR